MTDRGDLLVEVDELAALLATGAPQLRILDVRWSLAQPDGRALFAAGHIPGAVYVDLDTQLAAPGAATDGRHPLPSHASLQESARALGINDGDQIIAYDGGGNFASARLWWLFRNAGFTSVRLLDGAYPLWVAAGHELETGPGITPKPGNVTLTDGHLATLTMEQVGSFAARQDTLLLDVRAPERYRGESEPIDPRAGHIPGAVNAPTSDNVAADGRFLASDALRSRFLGYGSEEVARIASYCGSGVTASHNTFALALAGFDGALYPGSWSQWSNDPERPIATGARP